MAANNTHVNYAACNDQLTATQLAAHHSIGVVNSHVRRNYSRRSNGRRAPGIRINAEHIVAEYRKIILKLKCFVWLRR